MSLFAAMTEASFFGTNTQRLFGLGMQDAALCHIALYMSHNSATLLWPCNPVCNGLFVAPFVILATNAAENACWDLSTALTVDRSRTDRGLTKI